jgi:hypothetical protein
VRDGTDIDSYTGDRIGQCNWESYYTYVYTYKKMDSDDSTTDSTSSEGVNSNNFKRLRSNEKEPRCVVTYRLNHGLCFKCGVKLYDVGPNNELTPLNMSGIVMNGRCLLCYPLRTMPLQYVNVSNPEDSTRASGATLASSAAFLDTNKNKMVTTTTTKIQNTLE